MTTPEAAELFDTLRPPSPFMTDEHAQWRAQVRSFVDNTIAPHIDDWERAGSVPDELFARAAADGLLGVGFPAQCGGTHEGADPYYRVILAEELHRLGCGVAYAELATHWIALPPVVRFGSPALIDEVVRPVLAGSKKIAFAVTEPGGGSDVAALQTTATRDGSDWCVNGRKTLISGGMRADYLLTAVRTGGDGLAGISMLLIPSAATGVGRSRISGLEWYSAGLADIELNNVVVPGDWLIGDENRGFAALASQFNVERISAVAAALAMSRVAVAEAMTYAKWRTAFGKRLVDHQSLRHRLVSLQARISGCYAWLDRSVWYLQNGVDVIADLALLKVQATETLDICARESMHILAGAAYTGSSRAERIYREARIFSLGGGTAEVLSDMAARQLGISR